jgi:secretion/DNA translocation related TadE-like protein
MVHPCRRDERGSGTFLMVGIMAVLLFVSLGGICIAGYLVAGHRARSAADLAALSGAAAFARGQDACSAARGNARANGAEVVDCSQVGDAIDFVVTVQVEISVKITVPGLPTKIGAIAYAGAEDSTDQGSAVPGGGQGPT